MKKKKKGNVLIIIAILLVMLGLDIHYRPDDIYNPVMNWIYQTFINKDVQKQAIHTQQEDIKIDNSGESGTTTMADIFGEKWNGSEVLRGYIASPDLKLENLPIIQGSNQHTMRLGATEPKMKNDGKTNEADIMGQENYALSAHNMNAGTWGFSALQDDIQSPYQDIKQSSLNFNKHYNKGDIYLSDGQKVYKYKLTHKYVIDNVPGSIQEVMNDHKEAGVDNMLTLTSCLTYAGHQGETPYRIIVHANLQSTEDFATAEKTVKDLFPYIKDNGQLMRNK